VTNPNESKIMTNIVINVASPPFKKSADQPVVKERKANLSCYISVPSKKKEPEPEVVQENLFSASKSSDGKGVYKKLKISNVKPRVDCWNRSSSRGEITPTRPTR